MAEPAPQEFPGAVLIARCPEHGLHGERDECFECGGAVDQVEMVEVARLPYVLAFRGQQELALLRSLLRRYIRRQPAILTVGERNEERAARSLLERLEELG